MNPFEELGTLIFACLTPENIMVFGPWGPCTQDVYYQCLPSKFCHRDFVLNYVAIGEKRTFRYNRDFFGTYSGADWDFYRYWHQNAELLEITRKHDNPISGGLAMGH